jgi:hypothetical protein
VSSPLETWAVLRRPGFGRVPPWPEDPLLQSEQRTGPLLAVQL